MRTKEFKGVGLAVEDYDCLLKIQREVQKWADIDHESAPAEITVGFH